jgi:hypothetical protein
MPMLPRRSTDGADDADDGVADDASADGEA